MYKKLIFLFFQSVCFVIVSCAQAFEIGATIGAANYLGDLSPELVIKETKPAGGIFARYNLSSSFALTGSFSSGMVSGSDANFNQNSYRNLSFRSMVYEYAGIVEFNYFKYGVGVLDKHLTSYIFVGLAGFNFNPQANIRGEWMNLSNIQTEGKKYNKFSMAIPFGMGVKWRVGKHLALEANVGFRKTYTDYLDDVSGVYPNVLEQLNKRGPLGAMLTDRSVEITKQPFTSKEGMSRGNSDFKDWYIMSGISLTYRFYSRIKCVRFY